MYTHAECYTSMMRQKGLSHPWEPEYSKDSKLLILGTFPSPSSREMGFYYGHPQNVFWKSLALSLGVPEPPCDVEARRNLLRESGVALWDVFKSLDINGAADASIKNAEPNTFRKILETSSISAIFTTGRTATDAFNRLCSKEAGLRAIYLPSTSPANRRGQTTPEYAHRWSLVGKLLRHELVSGLEMKRLDQKTIGEKGVSSLELMERAACAVVEALRTGVLTNELQGAGPQGTGARAFELQGSKKVLCVCGTGNNGGDGFAVARQLHSAGLPAEVLFIGSHEKRSDETIAQYRLAQDSGVVIHENDLSIIRGFPILVDALFGIGLTRSLSGVYLEVVNEMCAAREAGAYVLAVDIPSGISSDTGEPLNKAVKADETVTFAFNKIGLTIGAGPANAGRITIADIGITA